MLDSQLVAEGGGRARWELRPPATLATVLVLALSAGCASAPPPAAEAPAVRAPAGPVLRHDPARYDAALADLVFAGSDAVRPRPGARAAGEAATLAARAAALRAERRWEESLAAAAAAIVAAPERPEGYEELAATLVRRREPARAEAALRSALRVDPHRVETRHRLAELLWTRARRGEAEAEWRRVVAARPEHGPALARLATAAFLRGDGEEAAEWAVRAEAEGEVLPAPLRPPVPLPPLATSAAADFEIVPAPPVRLDPGGGAAQAGEANVAVVRRGGAERLVVAWMDTRLAGEGAEWRIAAAASDDGGATWTPDAVLPPPAGFETRFDFDPTFAVDPESGTVLLVAATFSPNPSLWLRRDAPDAPGLGAPEVAYTGFVDRPWLAAGPAPGGGGGTRLYLTSDRGLMRSDDLGASWSAPQPLPGGVPLPRVGPDGELYAVNKRSATASVDLLRSLDGGATFEPPRQIASPVDDWLAADTSRVPGALRVVPLPVLAVDPVSGVLYAMWFDTVAVDGSETDLDLFLSRSADRGATWSIPVALFPGAGDQILPWIEVDGRGRLHLVYVDTGRGGALDPDPAALVDVVYAASADGGATWRSARLTERPFSTAGALWGGIGGNQFLGDYLGLAPVEGGAFVAYPAASPAGDLDLYGQRIALVEECSPADALCLGGGRFRVSATWRTADGGEGVGHPLPLTADSGTFWFFDPANLELVVKALDGCPVNGHKWVFAAGLTNVEVTLRVEDLVAGRSRVYTNPQGTPFQPITDTAAFATCP